MSKIKKKFKPRKGSKRLIVRGTEYAWKAGSRFTEIRRVSDGKKLVIENEKLYEKVPSDTCFCYICEVYDECDCLWSQPSMYITRVTPYRVASIVRGYFE